MNGKHGFLAILVPSATVFISSFCIMVLELVASRLIARHLGSSLYTWTAVIGVVLAGITVGNYTGGRIADRFKARKALSIIFLLCAASCVLTAVLNNTVGHWLFLWRFSWPVRVFCHVSLVFLLPSLLLGTISPVVAKMALDRGLPQGRTVGDIYAWGAAGSIAGTFAAGYFLIAAMGTVAIVWIVGLVLLIMSILYWAKFVPIYGAAVVFAALMSLGLSGNSQAQILAAKLALRAEPDPSVIYEDETQYCYVAVRLISENPDIRGFYQDKLKHSGINMDDLSDLQYFYTEIYAAVTSELSKGKDRLSVMVIGGGGYVYPRYVQEHWPGSRVDVVEIDPGVTEAAMQSFGLSPDTTINTFNMDARNYVDDLLEKEAKGQSIQKYDFIYEDAINDYSVPFQLTTKEFNDKIAKLLTDDGAYMVNLIDVFDSGLFLGAVFNTLSETYPHVYIMATKMPSRIRNTFVLIATKQALNPDQAILNYKGGTLEIWILDESQIAALREKSSGLVLADDYAPVENLLAPVVRDSAKELLASEYMSRAKESKEQKDYKKSVAYYQAAIRTNLPAAIPAYNEIGLIQAETGQLAQAAESFRKAIEYNDAREKKSNLAAIHYSLGVTLQRLGQPEQAQQEFDKAVADFKAELDKHPDWYESWNRLGDTYATMGKFDLAAEAFEKAFSLKPTDKKYFDSLLRALEFAGKYDAAIDLLNKQIAAMKQDNAPPEAIAQLQEQLEFFQFKRSRP